MICTASHDFEALLRNTGLRLTKGRLAILSSLHTKGLQSADELQTASGGLFDRVTAYRTLKQLLAVGVVVPVAHAEGAVRYELADHHTERVVCTSCGMSEQLPECGCEQLEKHALKNSSAFSTVRAHAVEFFGVCKRCARV